MMRLAHLRGCEVPSAASPCAPVCFARVPLLTLNPIVSCPGGETERPLALSRQQPQKENTDKYPRKKEGECSRFFDSCGPSGFLIGVTALLLSIVQIIIDVVRVCGSLVLDVACAGPKVYP